MLAYHRMIDSIRPYTHTEYSKLVAHQFMPMDHVYIWLHEFLLLICAVVSYICLSRERSRLAFLYLLTSPSEMNTTASKCCLATEHENALKRREQDTNQIDWLTSLGLDKLLKSIK